MTGTRRSDCCAALMPPIAMRRLFLHAVLPTAFVGALFPFVSRVQDSARLPTALAALIAAVVAWRVWPTLARGRTRNLIAAAIAASLLPAIVLGWYDGRTALFVVAGETLLGWSLAGWLFLHRDDGAHASGTARSGVATVVPAWVLPVLVGLAFIIAGTSLALVSGKWIIGGDDSIYALQARWLSWPGYGWTVPEALRPHFLMRKLAIGPAGQFFGQYPPGWPAIMALFSAMGLHWVTTAILGALSAYGTFRLGRLLYDARVGALATGLLIVNALWVAQHGTWMAHAMTLPCALFTALWLLESESRNGWARMWRWFAAGLSIALLAASRPLDGVVLAVTFGSWMLVRGNLAPRDVAQCLVVAGLGALPVTAALLHYHVVSNGEAFQFGYDVINQGGNALGWGKRGVVGLDSTLTRVPRFFAYTPSMSLRELVRRVASANLFLAPYAMSVPLLLLLRRAGHRVSWRVAVPFFALPAVYSVYWYGEMRFFLVLIPFLLVWLAAGIERMRTREPQLASLVVTAMLVGSVGLLVPGRWERLPIEEPFGRNGYTAKAPLVDALERLSALRARHGKLLVIVKDDGSVFDPIIDRLYQFNREGLDSDILVVRDRRADNARAIALLPGRTVVEVRDAPRGKPKTITVIAPPR